ncbi:cell wall hydrolase [Pseudogemmobacter humi]|uniref:Spore cortex-lytic enzyme n=1 Tax=Pseudogemmobacter humi TaxID=2483812 RepID=A0A3P5XDP5_9RHOB|nr:cell wall hydrolase [Pseudogemmobacter humi]VDC32975.1 Spore cortex-lytic enzyme precursor [Pseudogemmobacter humi]
MTRLGNTLAAGLTAAIAFTQAADADVTRSDRNDPKTAIADEMGLLLGNEKSRLNGLSDQALGTIASGPEKTGPEKTGPVKTVVKRTVVRKAADPAETASGTVTEVTDEKTGEKKIRRVIVKKSETPKAGFQLFGKKSPAPEAPAQTMTVRYDAGWLMAQPAPEGGQEWQCLTEAIYFESRGESLKGQFAVAEVILNRVESGLYPRSVCGVVKQRGGGGCQFSYTCNGSSTKMRDGYSREIAGRIASVMLNGAPRELTAGATHFHTRAVAPSWSKRFARTISIGSHLFYRQPGVRG